MLKNGGGFLLRGTLLCACACLSFMAQAGPGPGDPGFGPWKYSGYFITKQHGKEGVFFDSSKMRFENHDRIVKVWVRTYMLDDVVKAIESLKYQSEMKAKFRAGYRAPFIRRKDIQQTIPASDRRMALVEFTYFEAIVNLAPVQPVLSGRVVIDCSKHTIHIESRRTYDKTGKVILDQVLEHDKSNPTAQQTWTGWTEMLVCDPSLRNP